MIANIRFYKSELSAKSYGETNAPIIFGILIVLGISAVNPGASDLTDRFEHGDFPGVLFQFHLHYHHWIRPPENDDLTYYSCVIFFDYRFILY